MELRKDVAKSMCHDVNTAERFYVALPDKEAAYNARKLRMKALTLDSCLKTYISHLKYKAFKKESNIRPPPPSTTSSSDDEQVVLDDDTEFSDSSLSEDERQMRKRKHCDTWQDETPVQRKLNFPNRPELKAVSVRLKRLDDYAVKFYLAKSTCAVSVATTDGPGQVCPSLPKQLAVESEHRAFSIVMPSTQQSAPPESEHQAFSIVMPSAQQSAPPKSEDHTFPILVPETQQSTQPKSE